MHWSQLIVLIRVSLANCNIPMSEHSCIWMQYRAQMWTLYCWKPRERKNISICGFVLHVQDSSAEQDREKVKRKRFQQMGELYVFFEDEKVSSKSFQ